MPEFGEAMGVDELADREKRLQLDEYYDWSASERRISVLDAKEWTDIALRIGFAVVIAGLFILLNFFVCFILWKLITYDQQLVEKCGSSAVNLRVTPEVLMALVGATAVQAGAALVVIARYLFPSGKPDVSA